ncbi:FkbM family methyltransferase [Kordiimonas laminariae]|uniref:FkbM family methyltransferase n=1 Tax=Kordiimonas laminariae TaxID=2917717 RepID=UPI001FF1B80E|nr:FkbM family methyltransferase [Kordiimonas laminariae]MCK0070285.1 FkbM family methyltransferase [Kordiimonas laminariae]
MSVLNITKKILNNTKLYSTGARLYHYLKQVMMRLSLINSETLYLKPMKPVGHYKSQYGQDFYLEKLQLISRGGFFVEVGCNHPQQNSNSYFLEHQYGFSGISIDAIDYSTEYEQLRPRTKFHRILIDIIPGKRDFYQVIDEEGWENQVSSVYQDTLFRGKGFKAKKIEIDAVPLKDLIGDRKHIDVLLIDVEGYEFNVLDSLEWSKVKPSVVVVENNGDFYPRSKMEEYMKGKGYLFVARIGVWDDIYKLQ